MSPLCPTSAHAPHVHSSWPTGLASRAVRLSDNSEEAMRLLTSQYSRIACDPLIIDRLTNRASTQQNRSLASSQLPLTTCVLKYHPLLRHAVAAALKEVAFPPTLGFSIRIAWKNALPSVSSLITRHNLRHTHGQEGGNSVCDKSTCPTHHTSLLALASN